MVCVDQGRLLSVCLEDPTTKIQSLFPPGGMVEDGEAPADAAIRETKEETGYLVSVFQDSHFFTDYDFLWNSSLVACRTHWFLAELVEGQTPVIVDDAPYNKGSVWIDLGEVRDQITDHTVIREAVFRLLEGGSDGRDT